MTTVDVQTEVVISAPIDRVSQYASDPDNAPEWYVNIKSVDWKTPKPPATGSRIAFVAQFLGRTLEYTYEIIEFKPGQKLVMQTTEGPFPMRTIYTWDKTPDGNTRMTLRNTGQAAGFSKLLAPFMSAMMRRANSKDLGKLKRILENRTRKE